MTFQKKIESTAYKFKTFEEKMAYLQGLGDGLERGREILNSYSPDLTHEGVETTESKVRCEILN